LAGRNYEENPTGWTPFPARHAPPIGIPAANYITFSIIAHIDHGKSSLSQVLLERSGNIPTQGKDGDPRTVTQDALDTLEVEKQRGITVKAVTATMLYKSDDGQRWMINLIDTPGHADFAHEVRRSLTACDGALLLVDSSQGVEAQTLAVAEAAKKHNVLLAAACSKIDLPHAEPDDVALAIAGFGLVEDPEAVLQISAKTGKGVAQVLPMIVNNFAEARRLKIPDGDAIRLLPLRARVLDSKYDKTRGVISTIQVVEGEIREQQRITMMGSKEVGSMGVQELGLLGPAPIRTKALTAGCVGYMVCGYVLFVAFVALQTVASGCERSGTPSSATPSATWLSWTRRCATIAATGR
jgi:small GTP-binding protein